MKVLRGYLAFVLAACIVNAEWLRWIFFFGKYGTRGRGFAPSAIANRPRANYNTELKSFFFFFPSVARMK